MILLALVAAGVIGYRAFFPASTNPTPAPAMLPPVVSTSSIPVAVGNPPIALQAVPVVLNTSAAVIPASSPAVGLARGGGSGIVSSRMYVPHNQSIARALRNTL